jgi:hypothetical protein
LAEAVFTPAGKAAADLVARSFPTVRSFRSTAILLCKRAPTGWNILKPARNRDVVSFRMLHLGLDQGNRCLLCVQTLYRCNAFDPYAQASQLVERDLEHRISVSIGG